MAAVGFGKGLRFAGYASVFDRLDKGGDIVRQGAFRRTLAKGVAVPLLWQHQTGQQVGTIEHLKEDARGLQVIGRLHDSALAQMIGRDLQRGILTGLSFGYRVASARRSQRIREIDDLELFEVSLVHPMQPLARIHKLEA